MFRSLNPRSAPPTAATAAKPPISDTARKSPLALRPSPPPAHIDRECFETQPCQRRWPGAFALRRAVPFPPFPDFTFFSNPSPHARSTSPQRPRLLPYKSLMGRARHTPSSAPGAFCTASTNPKTAHFFSFLFFCPPQSWAYLSVLEPHRTEVSSGNII